MPNYQNSMFLLIALYLHIHQQRSDIYRVLEQVSQSVKSFGILTTSGFFFLLLLSTKLAVSISNKNRNSQLRYFTNPS